MSKGKQTRNAILDQALDLASEVGLEGLTIGVLAKLVGMSKSGLYAHFDSKEDLQLQVLETASDRFVDVVLTPSFKQRRGLPRLRALFENWLRWETEELAGGCPFIAAAVELDDRRGAVRDRLDTDLRDLFGAVAQAGRIAVEEGHLEADLDVDQFAYEFWAILLAYHHYARFMRDENAVTFARRSFARLINDTSGA